MLIIILFAGIVNYPGQMSGGSVVVSTSAWHAAVRGSILGSGMFYFRCKNLALNIRDWVSLGSSAVGSLLQNLVDFVYPTLPVSFRED